MEEIKNAQHIPHNSSDTVWKGFKFPTGRFLVWSPNGQVAIGKSDPITEKVLEWHEIS